MGQYNRSQSFKNSPGYERRRRKVLDKAGNRGLVAAGWYAEGNKLTGETFAEFRKLMKQADKDFELNYKSITT